MAITDIQQNRLTTICIAEDRKSCEPALKLLLASLHKYCRGSSIDVFYPPADINFCSWAGQFAQIRLHTKPLAGAYGWNVKPQAILYLLDRGYDEIVWIDSDVILMGNIFHLFSDVDINTIVATEEALWGRPKDPSGLRARLWGFRVGRILPFTLNTAVTRFTKSHYLFLRRWQEILESKEYQDAQQVVWYNRPVHMMGDQDVFTALLSSDEFSQTPIKILRRGRDIIQYFGLYGYTSLERFINLLCSRPSLIHSQGEKPWIANWESGHSHGLRKYVERLYLDLSPYTLCARPFRTNLGDGTAWMRAHSATSAILRAVGLWYPPLVGLPLALLIDVMRLAKYLFADAARTKNQ